MIDELIETAKKKGASDLHLESGLPAIYRVNGELNIQGEAISSDALYDIARQIVDNENWPDFINKGSFDTSRNIQKCPVSY